MVLIQIYVSSHPVLLIILLTPCHARYAKKFRSYMHDSLRKYFSNKIHLGVARILTYYIWMVANVEFCMLLQANSIFKKEITTACFYYLDKFILLTSGNEIYLYKYHIDTSKPDDIKRYIGNSYASCIAFSQTPLHLC